MKSNLLSKSLSRNFFATFFVAFLMLLNFTAFAQLTGTITIGSVNYPTIKVAVDSLNLYGVAGGGGVTFNVPAGYTEILTARLNMTATGSLSDQIVFQKSGAGANPVITSYVGTNATPSTTADGFWAFAGSDYVTIDGIDLQEAAGNTTATTVMEFGFGLFKASATNGCQNNTIKNCTISLNRVQNTTWTSPGHNGSNGIAVINGLYNAVGVVTVTAASGSNSFNKFYSNTIQNCNAGIVFIGFAATTPFTFGTGGFGDTGNDVGGTSLLTGNNIVNFGGGASPTNPATGVFMNNDWDFNISYNTINNNNGSGVNHAQIIRGIFCNLSSNGASGNINNNNVSIKSGGNFQVSCIENAAGTSGSGNTININNNTISNCTNTTFTTALWYGIWNNGNNPTNLNIQNNIFSNNQTNATTGSNYLIYNSGAVPGTINITGNQLSQAFVGASANSATNYMIYNGSGTTTTNLNISTNIFSNITFATTGTGATYFIYNTNSNANYTLNANNWSSLTFNYSGSHYVMYNSSNTQVALNVTNNIISNWTRTAAAGTMYIYYAGSSSLPTSTQTFSGNSFTNITATTSGTGTFYMMYNSDGASSPYPRKNIFNNIWQNINYNTTGTVYMNYTSYLGDGSGASGSNIYNNTWDNITTAASTLYGLYSSTTISPNYAPNIYGNTISNITSNGTTYGCYAGSSTIGANYFKNKIFNIQTTSTTGAAYGLYVLSASPYNIYNNIIGDIKAPASTLTAPAPSVAGVYLSTGSIVNVYDNTVYLSAATTSTGVNWGSAAIYATTTPTLTLRNNILINLSVPKGTGKAIAYQRSSTTSSTYGLTSNNNDLYAGTPGVNNLLFYDGTNSDQNIMNFKARFYPIDALSGTENPTFLSLVGANANYLHIDPTVATNLESGALNITGITDDFDSHTRQGNGGYVGTGTAPDIGADEFGGIAMAALAPPINFTSNTNTVNSFNITWDDNSVGEAGFVVYRALSPGGPFNTIVGALVSTSVGTTGTTYSLAQTGLLGGTTYYYQVVANNFTSSAPLNGNAATLGCGSGLAGTYTIPGVPYASLTAAISALQTNGMSAPVILELDPTYVGAGETYPLTFSNLIGCLNPTNTLTLRPAATVAAPLTITSANTIATIDINGANFVTIDGRPGGVGTNKYLIIENTSTTVSFAGNSILIRNEASNNTVTYCEVRAANANAASSAAITTTGLIPGAIAIGTTSNASGFGNDNNTISYCDIHSLASGGNIGACIYAGNGTTAGSNANNDYNTIDNCNIYDFYLATSASAGIDVALGNNSWTITNNHVYQTGSRNYAAGTQAIRGFWITPNTASLSSASGFIINGNYIGGNAANGTGVYTITGTANYVFRGMDISVGFGTPTSIQNNTMTNWNVTGGFTGNSVYGIDVNAGNANIGTTTGNLVGSTTTTGSITVTTTVTGGSFIGLRSGSASGGTINFSNNTVSGIDMIGNATTIATGFNGIAGSGGANITVNNNIVGSATLANSINMVSTSSTSTNAVAVRGIIDNSTATGVVNTITNNLVANINTNNNATGTQTSTLLGISVTTGASTISGNIIRNLTSASQTTAGGGTPVVLGINYSSTATPTIISNNTIHTLKSTHPTVTAAIQTAGIYFSGPSSGTHTIERNFIHSISIASPTNSAGFITGIDLGVISGATITVRNNMIRLGLDENGASVISPCTIRGITKNVPSSNIWFNSIYIGGTGVGTTATNTFCLARSATATDDWRNNILVNNRSNATTGGKHYSINLNAATTLTLDYNDYQGTGTGYVFGFNGADVSSYFANWVTGDAHSYTADPMFINPTGTSATVDMHIDPINATIIEGTGTPIASVTNDYDNDTRSGLTPTDMGADAGNFVSLVCNGTPLGGYSSLSFPGALCVSGTKTINLSGYTNVPGISLQWQQSASTGGPYVNVSGGSGATTASYTTSLINSNTYYVCLVTCSNGGTTALSSETLVEVSNPVIATTTPGQRCGSGTVDLAATAPGYTISWYDVPAGGNTLGTGTSFTTPIISTSTSFYAVASTPPVPFTSQVGTGTTTSTSVVGSPLTSNYGAEHHQYIIRASELLALGFSGGNITSLQFNLAAAFSGYTAYNYKIQMANTALSAFSSAALITTGFTTCFNGTWPVSGGAAVGVANPSIPAGWQTFNFSSPFSWDGFSNVVVDVSFLNCTVCNGTSSCTTTFTTGSTWQYTTTLFTSVFYLYADGNCTINSMSPTGGNTGTTTTRPNMILSGQNACYGNRVAVLAGVSTALPFTINANQTVCNNEVATLSVTTPLTNFNKYTWSPSANLYQNSACTIPYTNENLSTVYAQTATPGVTTYTCTANDTITLCAGLQSNTLTVLPAVALTASASITDICVSGSSVLSITPTTDIPAANVVWQNSTDNLNFVDIVGSSGLTYGVSLNLVSYYYRAVVRNSTGTDCIVSSSVLINVNNPILLSANNVTRCGVGTVNLCATASPGNTINWYSSPIGGVPLTSPYFNVPVTGFNNDIVAGGVGTNSILGTTYAFGPDGAGYTFMDNTFKYTSANALPSCFMPANKLAPSLLTSGLTYQFQDYGNGATLNNNSLSIANQSTAYTSPLPSTGTFTLTTPASFANLRVLYESVINAAPLTVDATVTFTDNSTQSFPGNACVNWFTASGVVYSGMGRTTPAGVIQCGATPNMFELNLPISSLNQVKQVQSITFSIPTVLTTGAYPYSINYFHAMAVGGNAPTTPGCFTTPTLSTTTTYYATASSGGFSANVGLVAPPSYYNYTTGAYGIIFDALVPLTINTVDVYPAAASNGTPGTVTIVLQNSAGTTLQSVTVNVLGYVTPLTASAKNTVYLGFTVPPGTGYRLTRTAHTGITGLQYECGVGGNCSTIFYSGGYPTSIAGVITQTGGHLGSATSYNYYSNYFYNWAVSTGCESSRVPVLAIVTAPPALTVSASQSACYNTIVPVSVTSNIPDFDSYVWTPATNLFTDSNASNPYNGTSSATSLYYKTTAVGTTTYTCTANQSSGSLCANAVTTAITNVADLSTSTFSTVQQFDCNSQNLITVTPSSSAPLLPWYSNDFSSATMNPLQAQLFGPDAVITNGLLALDGTTSVTTGTNGAIQVFNPNAIDAKAFQIDFDLNVVYGNGNADGVSYSFGDDVNPTNVVTAQFTGSISGTTLTVTSVAAGTIQIGKYLGSLNGTGGSGSVASAMITGFVSGINGGVGVYTIDVPQTVASNSSLCLGTTPENGSGSKLKLSFDSYVNASNVQGIYLMYNSNSANQTPTSPGVIGYVANNTWFSTGSVTKHISITINNSGQVTVSLGGVVIFNNIQLPPSYLTSNKSNWSHVFRARTGSVFEQHNIDNFVVQYIDPNFFQYSINGGTNWQTSNVFSVAAGTYPVSISLGGNLSCNATLGNAIINQPVFNAAATSVNVCSNNPNMPTLSFAPGFTGASYQWQSSPAGANTWTDILNATSITYTPLTLAQSLDFRIKILCGGNQISGSPSNAITVNLVNPTVSNPIPGSRCGVGTVDLSATGTPGSTLTWYPSATGGAPLGTGSPFTTPPISSTTSYYVAAVTGSTNYSVGKTDFTYYGNSTGATTYGLQFDALTDFTLNSVVVYPYSATNGTAGTMTIGIANSGGTILQQATVNVTGYNQSTTPTPQTVNLNFNISTGIGYRLILISFTGITSVCYQYSGGSATPYAFPYAVPGTVSITNALLAGTSYNYYYYYFYDWSINTGCSSARTLVTATVAQPPAVAINASATNICSGFGTTLTASSPSNPNYTYEWNPGGLPGATVTVNPVVTTRYTVTATDNSGGTTFGCVDTETVFINVNPLPPVVTATPASTFLCGGGSQVITANATSLSSFVISGTSPSTTVSPPSPFYRTFEGFHQQYLIRASELTTAGVVAGNITSISFNVSTLSTTYTQWNHEGYTIKIGSTGLTDLSTTWETVPNVVYGPTSYTPTAGANTFPFSSPYTWDGVSNVVIEVCFDNDPGGTCSTSTPICWGNTVTASIATAAFTACRYYYADNTSSGIPRDICGSTTLTSTTTTRPIMTFGFAGALNFSWSPAAGLNTTVGQTVTASPSINTTYTVTSTNIFGCTRTASSSISLVAKPAPKIVEGDTAVCGNSPGYYLHVIDTGAFAGGYPYGTYFDWVDWTGPVFGLDSFLVNSSYAYKVVVMLPGSYGSCYDTSNVVQADFTGAQAPVPLVDQDTVSCFGASDGMAFVNLIVGGDPMVNYKWYNSSNVLLRNVTTSSIDDTLKNVPAGTYTVVVTNNLGSSFLSCEEYGTVEVLQPFPLSASENTSNHINNLCYESLGGAIDIDVNGGTADYIYNWSNGETTEDLTGLANGTYTVSISDYHGCSLSPFSVIITSPQPLSVVCTKTNVSCLGHDNGTGLLTASGGTEGYGYQWDNGATTASISNLAPGVYCGTVTDSHGCSGSCCISITQPNQLTIGAALTNVTCKNAKDGTVSLTPSGGTSPYTYLWNNGNGNANRTGLAPGTYTVIVTDANGCQATNFYTILQAPTILTNNIIKTNVQCGGKCTGKATANPIGGVAPYTYLWNNGSTATSISALCAGTYTLTVTDSYHCVKTVAFQITQNPVLTLVAIPSGPTQASASASGGVAPYAYYWSTVPPQSNATATGLFPGTSYKVKVTDYKGCTKTTVVSMPVPKNGITVATGSDNISVYPNPTTGHVTVDFNEMQSGLHYTLKLFDVTGREIFSNEAIKEAGINSVDYEFGTLPKGIYTMSIQTEKGISVVKILIQ